MLAKLFTLFTSCGIFTQSLSLFMEDMEKLSRSSNGMHDANINYRVRLCNIACPSTN